MISKDGNLDANTFDIGLVWRFGTPKLNPQSVSWSENKVVILEQM